jgi:hypothetical protein
MMSLQEEEQHQMQDAAEHLEEQEEAEDDIDEAAQVQANRSNMTILHFLMTAPKWSISLFLFMAARSVPLLTPHKAVQRPLERLHTMIELESNSYLQCTKRAFVRLDTQLEKVATAESERIRRARESNQEIIRLAQEHTGACVNATKKARDSLVQWSNDGMILPFVNDSSICTERHHETVIDFLGEEFRVVENEVSSIFDGYLQSSMDSLELIRSYAQARIDYDFEYFVTGRIQPVLGVLENRADVESFRAFVSEMELESRIRGSLEQVAETLDQAMTRVDTLNARVRDFSASINALYVSYTDVYDRLVQGTDFVLDILPPGVPLPGVFDLSSVPLGTSLLPPIMSVPAFRGELEATRALLDNVTSQSLAIFNDVIHDLEEQASHQLRGASNDLASELGGLLEFSDYNPPKFTGSNQDISDLSEEVAFYIELGKAARAKTTDALDRLQSIGEDEADILSATPTIGEGNYSFADDSTTFDYYRPQFPSISIPELLEALMSWFVSNTWILEVLVQAIRLWKLESTYSRGAIPDLPEIDYGVADEDTDELTTKKALLWTILRTFATPWMLLLLVFFPVSIVAVVFWYPHVQMSCEISGEGTYLANSFLTPLLINEANALGNVLYIKGEFECRQSQRRLCDRMRLETDMLYRSDAASLHTIQLQHNHSIDKLWAVSRCVDPNINEHFNEACCGLRGYVAADCMEESTSFVCPVDDSVRPPAAFRPLGEYTSEPGCLQDILEWELEDGRFDCGPLLETCDHVPCTGVNEDMLRSQIIKSDCDVELYAIRCCLFLLAVLYHAILINIICTLIFNGIRQVLWRKLCPVGIKLRTQLSEDGDLVKGSEKTDRTDRIRTAIMRFEMLGKLQIVLGILALMGWFTSLFLIKA